MTIFASRLAELRNKEGLKQQELADRLNISKSSLGMYETAKRQPNLDLLLHIADYFGVLVDYMLRETDNPLPSANQKSIKVLNVKDEKDIANHIEEIKGDLQNADGLKFLDEPLSEEANESLLETLEYAIRQTQRINKKHIHDELRDKDSDN